MIAKSKSLVEICYRRAYVVNKLPVQVKVRHELRGDHLNVYYYYNLHPFTRPVFAFTSSWLTSDHKQRWQKAAFDQRHTQFAYIEASQNWIKWLWFGFVFYVTANMRHSVHIATLFYQGKVSNWLTSTSCTYFRLQLTYAEEISSWSISMKVWDLQLDSLPAVLQGWVQK